MSNFRNKQVQLTKTFAVTVSEFKMFDQSLQEQWILSYGRFIAVRQEPEFVIRLYKTDSFYAELFYHLTKKTPVSIRAFTNVEWLQPYLEGVDFRSVNFL